MKVRDIMTPDVEAVGTQTPFKEIAEILMRRGVSGAPVVNAVGRVVGVVSESDLLAREAYPHGSKRPGLVTVLAGRGDRLQAEARRAGELMSSPAICVSPDDSVHAAARLMVDNGVKRLPVVEDGRLTGIVSRHDILGVFARSDDELQVTLDAFLRRCLFVPPDHDVRVTVEGGVATLRGVVRFADDVRVCGALAEAFDGVVAVDNRLEHRSAAPEPAVSPRTPIR